MWRSSLSVASADTTTTIIITTVAALALSTPSSAQP
jgi:hypothetical protein